MTERMRKLWLKQSPCKGCLNSDSDSIMGSSFTYCSIVTDMQKFNESLFGKDFNKDVIIPMKDRVYRNCPFKEYVG